MKILMINLPYAGHTNPTLPLTEMLVQRGHDVTYINAETFRNRIEATGARFVPYLDFPAALGEQQVKHRCFPAAWRTAMALTEPFDLLIYEMFFYPGLDIARLKGIPCVRQFSQPAWSTQTFRQASPLFHVSARLIQAQMLSRHNLRQMDIRPRSMTDAIINDKPDLNLVYVSEAFQPCREDFGEDYLFAVPPQRPRASDVTIPYDQMRRPIVYISLGSLISNRGFCKECIRAFGGRDMSVILNTGKVDPAALGRIPENIHAYSFVPQLEVLSHADVFLTHCDMNSVNEALAAGVPMVAMPFVNDQTTNARRIVELGLGKRVRSFPSRGSELYRAVCEVCADTEMKRRVQAFATALQTDNVWESLLARIESL